MRKHWRGKTGDCSTGCPGCEDEWLAERARVWNERCAWLDGLTRRELTLVASRARRTRQKARAWFEELRGRDEAALDAVAVAELCDALDAAKWRLHREEDWLAEVERRLGAMVEAR